MPGARDTNSDVTADAIWGWRAVVSAERWSSANRPVAAALVTGVRVSYVGDAAKRLRDAADRAGRDALADEESGLSGLLEEARQHR